MPRVRRMRRAAAPGPAPSTLEETAVELADEEEDDQATGGDVDPAIAADPGPGSGAELAAPEVELGRLMTGGLAPAILAIVERGARRRPALVRSMGTEVELTVTGYPPVRIVFEDETVLVEDGPGAQPGLRVRGDLADLIGLLVAPALGGVPLPLSARGRSAVAVLASRRIRIQGRIRLLRRFMSIIRI